MTKLRMSGLLVLLAAAFAGNAFADLSGSTVSWQYYAYGGPYTSGTSSGTFTDDGTVGGTFIDLAGTIYFNIIAGPDYLLFDYSVATKSGAWSDSGLSKAPNLYNGVDIMFTGAPTITSISVDSATTMVGFDSTYLALLGGDEIEVDWRLLGFDTHTIVKVDIVSGTTIPEPGTLLLLGSGLLGTIGAVRRKINR